MTLTVVNNATLTCSFGTVPSALGVLPKAMVNAGSQPVATIMDHKPQVNIRPFGLCVTPSNPAVAAAQGTPQPCIPMTMSPWFPGTPLGTIGTIPIVNQSCKVMCNWGGVITVVNPGQPMAHNN